MLFQSTNFKKVRFDGIAYTIRKLSPSLFIDSETFPLNNIIEKINSSGNIEKSLENEKNKIVGLMKQVLDKAIIEASIGFRKIDLKVALEEVYSDVVKTSRLFSEAMALTFNVKKNRTLLSVLIKTFFH